MTHDINGPSRLALREQCPGSGRLEAQAPPEPESEYAARGKRLHAVLARCLRARRMPTLADVGDDPDDDAAVAAAWEAIAAIPAPPDALRLIECKTDLSHVGIPAGGTIDYAVVIPGGHFWLVDYKFGSQYVPAPRHNRQFHAYAVGLALDYGCIAGESILIQPALDRVDTDPVSAEDLANWRAQLTAITARARAADAPLVPGPHCDGCPARRGACPAAAQAAAVAQARAPIDPLQQFAVLPPDQRLHLYERMRLARAWLDGAIASADAAILAGQLQVPGLMVAEGRSSRAWIDAHRAATVLGALLGEAAYSAKILSPAQAEKALKAKGHRAAVLTPLVATVPGKPRVARDGTAGALP
jgi:RecB family exonuclease